MQNKVYRARRSKFKMFYVFEFVSVYFFINVSSNNKRQSKPPRRTTLVRCNFRERRTAVSDRAAIAIAFDGKRGEEDR